MRVRRIAAVALTLAATVLSTTAQQGDPASAATGTPAPAKAASTSTALTLDISGCGSCSVQLVHAIDGGGTVWHSKTKKVGTDGVVHFDVAKRRTHGLSFTLDAPWAGNIGAVPNLVTRYRGFDIGTEVTRSDARNADRAEGCWAGTDKSAKTLAFRVERVKAKAVDGTPTVIPLAYAPTTLHSWKPMLKTYKGTIGNQDALYCKKPAAQTKVVFRTGSCDGCEMNVYSAFWKHPHDTWQGRAHTISDGSISFMVPRTRIAGLSATISSPKEGNTGYLTQVAFRYGKKAPGDTVSFATARTKHHASGCYAGTSASKVVFDLGARLVSVEGNTGPTKGLIAWTKTTQPYLEPMKRTGDGILGSQELMYCGS